MDRDVLERAGMSRGWGGGGDELMCEDEIGVGGIILSGQRWIKVGETEWTEMT